MRPYLKDESELKSLTTDELKQLWVQELGGQSSRRGSRCWRSGSGTRDSCGCPQGLTPDKPKHHALIDFARPFTRRRRGAFINLRVRMRQA
jgi:hypothetical protein